MASSVAVVGLGRIGLPLALVAAVTERLMMYAINRKLEYFDMPQVRAIVRTAANDHYTLSSIALGIVNSEPFQMRASLGLDGTAPANKTGQVQ